MNHDHRVYSQAFGESLRLFVRHASTIALIVSDHQ